MSANTRRHWVIAAWTAAVLLSGPACVAAVWLAAAAGFVVFPDQAPKYAGPKGRENDFTEVLASAKDTGGSLGVFRQSIAPGSGPPAHVHTTADEMLYVVSGTFKVKVGDRVVEAPAQSMVFVPRGTPHTFENTGSSPGVLVVSVTPGGIEGMFKERQGVDAQAAAAIMKAHDTEVVGPPLK